MLGDHARSIDAEEGQSQDLAAAMTAAGAAGDSLQVCRPVKLTSIDWDDIMVFDLHWLATEVGYREPGTAWT